MSGIAIEQHSALQKIKISCKTCGVSESFYSNLSVEKFKARHSGHDVTSGNERAAPDRAPEEKVAPREMEATPTEMEATPTEMEATPTEMEPTPTEMEPTPTEMRPLGRGPGTKVAKVIVDLLDFPSLDSSIIRIRGFDTDLEEVFTATLSSAESAKVSEMLAAGEFVDHEASGLPYVWEPDVVEYVGDVKGRLGRIDEAQREATIAGPGPDPSESEEVIDQATVAGAADVLVDALSREEAFQTSGDTVADSLSHPLSDPSEAFDGVAPSLPAQSAQERRPEPELTEVRVLSPPAPSVPAEKVVERASNVVIAHAGEASEEDDYLLVSKSWYIQGGKGNRNEAVRVSKVLKAFRWKVEPVYTIGVILDDLLSIETNLSQISGSLIKRVESAGYRLTAVAIDQGKQSAWFKRDGSEMHQLHADSVLAGLDDPEIELEPDVTG